MPHPISCIVTPYIFKFYLSFNYQSSDHVDMGPARKRSILVHKEQMDGESVVSHQSNNGNCTLLF